MSVEFYRESPGKFDSRTLNRETLNRWTGRTTCSGAPVGVSDGAGDRGCTAAHSWAGGNNDNNNKNSTTTTTITTTITTTTTTNNNNNYLAT